MADDDGVGVVVVRRRWFVVSEWNESNVLVAFVSFIITVFCH